VYKSIILIINKKGLSMKYLNMCALMIIIISLGLSACLGGGGGDSGSSLATFSGFQDLSPNHTQQNQ